MKILKEKLKKDLKEIQIKQDKTKLKYMKHYYEGKKAYISELACYLEIDLEIEL